MFLLAALVACCALPVAAALALKFAGRNQTQPSKPLERPASSREAEPHH